MAKGYLYDNGDELISREDVNEVPDSSSAHAGDVLSLDSNKKPKWTTPESGLPSTGSASAGDVLSLDEDKEPVWSTPSGGGPLIVKATGTGTVDTSEPGLTLIKINADKTPTEIAEAINPSTFKGITVIFPVGDSLSSPYYSYASGIDYIMNSFEIKYDEELEFYYASGTSDMSADKVFRFRLNNDGTAYELWIMTNQST